jgi:aspartyl-tRNA(Asn)/glutamyl-tRNA(Gln) amidotransferase subunit B
LPGVRVELKNLATFNEILKATEYEIKRQKRMVNNHEVIKMETRTYDRESKQTIAIRSKEDQYDYRFMPEPNLLPLLVLPAKSQLKDHPELVYDLKLVDKP